MFSWLKELFRPPGVHTRIARFTPQEKPKRDPRGVDVEYAASELYSGTLHENLTQLRASFGPVARPNAALSYEDFAALEARSLAYLEVNGGIGNL